MLALLKNTAERHNNYKIFWRKRAVRDRVSSGRQPMLAVIILRASSIIRLFDEKKMTVLSTFSLAQPGHSHPEAMRNNGYSKPSNKIIDAYLIEGF